MKKIFYLLILILLPYEGMIFTGNAEPKHPDRNTLSEKPDTFMFTYAFKNKSEKGSRDLNYGGINLEDPQ